MKILITFFFFNQRIFPEYAKPPKASVLLSCYNRTVLYRSRDFLVAQRCQKRIHVTTENTFIL